MSTLDGIGVGVKRREGQEWEAPDSDFQTEFPGIYEWLARIAYRGVSREPASLTIKFLTGGVNLCLSAPHESVVGFHQGKTVQEALEGLEARLQHSTVEWKPRKPRHYPK